jgi:magnesium chelatase family protein
MLSIITSCALAGIDAYPVTVEVDITSGLPGFTMVGLPDSAVKEARERVFSALKNSGFVVPSKRITVNLAPGGIRKEGTAFDLPLALGILQASEQIDLGPLEGLVFMGELSLDGGLRPVRGALPAAIYSRQSGRRGIVLPHENGEEAALVQGAIVYAPVNLIDALQLLRRREPPPRPAKSPPARAAAGGMDFLEVKGQGDARRALEVAAAGGHNFLLIGSPGCGKTMMARRFPSILPPMTEAESLETTRIYSVAALLKPGRGLVGQRPFRAPHHSINDYALIGGGAGSPKPGEVSLAHNGVLFLDELPEYHRNVLEALRQPLEDGFVNIARVNQTLTYPCRFLLGAAMNPCPCGRLMDIRRKCQCRMEEIIRYRARISEPLLDRIDIQLEIPGLSYGEMESARPPESSERIRARVEAAREAQLRRFQGKRSSAALFCNAHMDGQTMRELCPLGRGPAQYLREAMESLGLSARAHDRLIKVARTIADLAGLESIGENHICEAVHFRSLDRRLDPFA